MLGTKYMVVNNEKRDPVCRGIYIQIRDGENGSTSTQIYDNIIP